MVIDIHIYIILRYIYQCIICTQQNIPIVYIYTYTLIYCNHIYVLNPVYTAPACFFKSIQKHLSDLGLICQKTKGTASIEWFFHCQRLPDCTRVDISPLEIDISKQKLPSGND